jgi:AcrR family transcriptional regulator
MPTERLRDRKREATRLRLVEAGHQLIHDRGFDATTTADIANAAGVTERTFFRHFPSKGEVVIAGWRRRAEACRHALEQAPREAPLIEVVRGGLHAFAADFTPEHETSRVNARALWANRPVALLLLDVVLDMENDVAAALARHLDRDADDLDIRVIANASIGVLRAAIRDVFTKEANDDLINAIDIGLVQIAGLLHQDRTRH